MKYTVWHNCYDSNLNGLVARESFAHPAKMARSLCERIFDHGQARGYWKPGDLIADPFGGIGTTGIVGAYRGYRVVSVELEHQFVELHQANIERNRTKWTRLGMPVPLVIEGDSRKLRELVAEATGSVMSPPWANITSNEVVDQDARKRLARKLRISNSEHVSPIDMGQRGFVPYGDNTSGQIGGFKEGDISAVIRDVRVGDRAAQGGAITSPPYENSLRSKKHGIDWHKVKPDYPGREWTAPVLDARERHHNNRTYGDSDGQIGAQDGETYWSAVSKVYQELYAMLVPGGAVAVVVKDYIKKRKRIPLCDQTSELMTAIGFRIVERCHAMLVKEQRAPSLFGGEQVLSRVERKSFFRRLAEKNGSPKIDYEEVIWAIKPR